MQALRRDLTRLTIALGVTLGLLGLTAQARGEDPPVPITVGGADWGIKESFRNYIEGSIAHGTIVVSEGASRNGDGSFHFPLAGGSYDPASQSTAARFAGRVHFSGHNGQLELDVSDLAVEITPAGAQVFADVASKSLADGKVVDYPNVNLAELDLEGIDPTVAAGATSWEELPATLTAAGAPTFSGFYQPGQELDPFGFEYEGPGGKPTPEAWTAPGTPGYQQLAAESGIGGAKALFVDRANGVVHVAGTDGVRALDLETLAAKGSATSAVALGANEYAFDAETGTVFAVQDAAAANPVRAFEWNSDSGTYAETSLPINAAKTTHLAYDPSDDTLFAVEGLASGVATPETSTMTPAVAAASRDGGGWQVGTYAALSTGGRAVSDIVRTGSGEFVASTHAYYTGATPTPTTVFPSPAVELTDTGSALTVKEIAGSVPPAPTANFTFGYSDPALAPNGTVLLRENYGSAPVAHMLRLQPGADGFTAGATIDLGASVFGSSVDDTDGTVFVAKTNLNRLDVLKGDAVAGAIKTPPTGVAELKPTYSAASDGTVYFNNNVAPTRIFAYRHVGDSPTITAEPQDASVTLTGSGGSAAVSFTAAAADPAPQVQWQERPLGAVVWTDVAGATAPTLEVTATAAAAGNRYRAVFSNLAGQIATRVASLGVTVLPAPPPNPTPADPTPTAPMPPPAAGVKPKLNLGVAHTISGKGVAALARIECRGTLICQLQAPKRAQLKVGSSSFWAKVIAPQAVMAGASTVVRLKLPPPALDAIAGRSGRATLKLVVSSGQQRLVRKLSIPLTGAAASASRKMY